MKYKIYGNHNSHMILILIANIPVTVQRHQLEESLANKGRLHLYTFLIFSSTVSIQRLWMHED